MAFELMLGHGVGSEIRRLLDRQLALAIDKLHGAPPDVAGARRHIKKTRALLLLARPAFATTDALASRLKKASRLLGPITDAQTMIQTLTKLRRYDPRRLPQKTIVKLRMALAEDARRLIGGVEAAWLRARVIRLLKHERMMLAKVDFSNCSVHSTAAAIRRAHRDARGARKASATAPGIDSLHAWRRRSKAEWYLLRLVHQVARGRLKDDQRRIEQLDRCLGDAHDLAVLEQRVTTRSPLSRSQSAAALRALHAYAGDLKRRTSILADAQDESPRDLEARVLALWLSGAGGLAAREVTSWRRRA